MNVEIKSLAREISVLMWKGEVTLCTAESCTSGQVASAITTVPGSSAYFKGGTVPYSNEMKTKLLGVSETLLEEKGAVSEEVAKAMVEGSLKLMDTNYAIGVTGFAGPGGGDEAPVGTIWIAVGSKKEILTTKLEADNGRDLNLRFATLSALQLMLELLKKDFPAVEE